MTVQSPGVPRAGQVVARFRRTLDGNTAPGSGELMDLLEQLLRTNLAQWDLEDVTRLAASSDADIAGAKRSIDRLNMERHHLVERIDAAIVAELPSPEDAPPSTESPAMALDRLSVLVIRTDRTERAARSGGPDAAILSGRLPRLHQQVEGLSAAIDALVDDVRAGNRRFMPYEHLKMYVP